MDEKKLLDFAKEHLRLLFVEDNEDARFLTSMLLEEFFKEVVSAENGVDALEKFEKGRFDVVLSDINMPKMNGIELLRRIRQIDNEVYTALLSAHSDSDFIIQSIEVGVDGYLIKPLEMEKFKKFLLNIAQKYYYRYEFKRYEAFLKAYENATNEAFLVSRTDKDGKITYANELFLEKSKYTLEEVLGKSHNIVRHPDNPKELYKRMWKTIKDEKKPFRILLRNRAKDGSSYYVDSIIYPILDENGKVIEYLSIRNDISDIMSQKKQLQFQIENTQNPIIVYTKLYNYDFLESTYTKKQLALIEQRSYDLIQQEFKNYFAFEKLYYLGEGEYAFIIENEPKKSLLRKIKEIQERIDNMAIAIEDFAYDIELLIAISYEKEKLIESAKQAIKLLERKKKRLFVTKSLMKQLEKKSKRYFSTLAKIKNALESDRFILHYQPIVDNETKEFVKYEALIRMQEGDRALSPFFFLEEAKQSPYYFDMSEKVVAKAFEAARKFDTHISINLSILDIQKPKMRKFIEEIVERNEDMAHKITFEILEDYDIENPVVIHNFLAKMKKSGILIAIDDFGSGYANYKRIVEYHPDILKIDGALIKDILSDRYSISILKGIVDFAKDLGIKTVAEFIENEAIYSIVKEIGIDYSQGYFFGKPLPLEEYRRR